MKWRLILIVGLACAVVASLIVWLQHARLVGSWLQVHTGTVNESGPYYGYAPIPQHAASRSRRRMVFDA
jgi:hypothetical protein